MMQLTRTGWSLCNDFNNITQAEGDDFTTANDFRQVGLVVDPTTFGTSSVATISTARQTYVVKGSSVSGTFTAEKINRNPTTGAVGKVVEFDSDRNLIYYQQERFADFGTSSTNGGFTAFSGTNVITGETSNNTYTI